MLTLKLADVAMWTHGSQRGADVEVRGVFTDSRKPQAGALFVALSGERFDAHQFAADAMKAGAAAALVSRPLPLDLPQVIVADTMHALGDLASAVRAQRHARVVGITGSNGKTTVKALLASILHDHCRVHVNAGNFNNEIGLPLSVLAMPEDTEVAVLEMGAGKLGDIAYLAGIARPEIGLVNNIAPAHLERMGSLEGIAETKGALYASLPGDGIAVINADDEFAATFQHMAGSRRILRFGLERDADVRAESMVLGQHSRFRLILPDAEIDIGLPLAGRHNVANALAAATLAHALAVPADTIRRGLGRADPVAGRMIREAMPGGWTLIDDSYNANPGSTAAAIETLVAEPGEAWLVLGDMRELGKDERALHAQIGRHAKVAGIARLYSVGELAGAAAKAFDGGQRHFPDQAKLAAALATDVHAGVRMLVKGSRGSAMENVIRALRGEIGGNGGGARHVA